MKEMKGMERLLGVVSLASLVAGCQQLELTGELIMGSPQRTILSSYEKPRIDLCVNLDSASSRDFYRLDPNRLNTMRGDGTRNQVICPELEIEGKLPDLRDGDKVTFRLTDGFYATHNMDNQGRRYFWLKSARPNGRLISYKAKR